MTQILLVDNGSSRPESTLQLRRLAAALGERLATPVYPVSLQHADKVPPKALDGVPADTFEPFLCRALQEGQRDFLAVPLFFGPSRALTQFIPEMVSDLAARLGPLHLRIAPELCPLPAGEPRLADILADQARATATAEGIPLRRVVLVDHGSPLPEVSAVRQWLAERLRHRLGDQVELRQAVMERRPGAAYDFNGRHLSDTLAEMAREDPQTPVILALLFLAPGRHAGAGGDIATIAAAAQAAHPGFRAHPSPLVGEHPALIGILADRAIQGRVDAVTAPAAP
ncbi:MAG: sirohydrochlorin chelatase [Bdellovibrio bacteriovorus]